MKARATILTLALCFFGAALCFGQNSEMGTWKLNETKSNLPSGVTKNTTVVYETQGEDVKVTIDGTDKDGKPIHTEWTGKFDGKDYPLTGDPSADSRSYTKTDEHTLSAASKKGDKVTTLAKIVVSADGKSRTVTVTGTDAEGKRVSGTAVYDKQE